MKGRSYIATLRRFSSAVDLSPSRAHNFSITNGQLYSAAFTLGGMFLAGAWIAYKVSAKMDAIAADLKSDQRDLRSDQRRVRHSFAEEQRRVQHSLEEERRYAAAWRQLAEQRAQLEQSFNHRNTDILFKVNGILPGSNMDSRDEQAAKGKANAVTVFKPNGNGHDLELSSAGGN
ncbi:hypothetical protein JCM10207_006823 [Rhodosporidiobolus poonsookiae]